MNTVNYSAEQKAIFAHFKSGTGNLVVEALAGTGKTTTLKAAFEHAPEQRILYAVFNKRNQKEAEAKITDIRVDVKTLHGLGYSFIKRVWPSAKPDSDVETSRVLKQAPLAGKDEIGMVLKLIGFAKNTCVNPTASDIIRIANEQDIDLGERQDRWVAVTLASIESAKIKDTAGRISFDDMVWLPVAANMVRPWYDLVCIDEAQDMNLPQLTMARQACKPGGRVVVVGDSRQAIYGFRGAVQDGMGMMKATLHAKTLKLTTTYRCPRLVVEKAAQLVPDYKSAPEAKEGLVASINDVAMFAKVAVGDAILSRLNAPLMPLALSFLRRNIPARIEGRDIGRQLIGMIRSLKATSVPDLLKKLQAWEKKQIDRLQNAKNSEKRIEQARDIAATLAAIAEGAKGVSEVESKLNSLFEDTNEQSKPAVILSSVHKAKGLEWNRVFLLQETFRASKGGEEANIYYVALTRSKSELYLVGGAGSQAVSEPLQGKNTLPVAEKPAKGQPDASTLPLKAAFEPAKIAMPAKLPPPRRAQNAVAQPAKSNLQVTFLDEDNTDVPPGQVRRKVGDVFMWAKSEFMVVDIRLGSAKAVCLSKAAKAVSEEGAEPSKSFSIPKEIRISACCDSADIIRHEENFRQGVPAGVVNNKQQNNSMSKNKTEKSGTIMDLVIGLATAGKTEKEITAAAKANYGAPSEHITYIIGREWRRNNKAKVVKAPKAAKAAPVKAAAKAPVKGKGKVAAPAPKAKAKKVATTAVPPPPAPKPAEQSETPAAQE